MASVGRPRGFSSDPPTGSGRARGSPHKWVFVRKHNKNNEIMKYKVLTTMKHIHPSFMQLRLLFNKLDNL